MKEIKWGLIGCGDISQKRVAPGIRDATRILDKIYGR